ncbi:hypothetical protein QWY81_08750 [Polaribacter undariae]|uniref:Uncharacterized protein n=1 Tax=Polaribacter sejongensis TaxID=985043 RepID=A0AAJ1QWF1_9FLAO|nr:hypothetical protein [Polaribacter undariae]MDN3619538.1 hypothetical protein [Polaribacter undariae]UWD32347.1 hypothetical protein NQP51_01460 [Polaribacter undariae]
MDIDNISKIEHFSAFVDLSLKEFCEQFSLLLSLPQMTFITEDETESAEVNFNGIDYNMSKPYKIGTLNEWDDNIPKEHNFGIVLSIDKANTDFNNTKLEAITNVIASNFNTDLLYYRTWFSNGFSTEKVYIFTPNKK